MSDIHDLQNITHQYRKSLEAFEERTNKQARMIDLAGNGEERQTIARMDADLSAIEQRMQDMAALKAAGGARAAALEARLAEPTYRAKPTEAKIIDRSSEEYAARWLKAVATADAGEMRALSLGSGGAGIPTDMERRIVDRMFQANVMRQICSGVDDRLEAHDSRAERAPDDRARRRSWHDHARGSHVLDRDLGRSLQVRHRGHDVAGVHRGRDRSGRHRLGSPVRRGQVRPLDRLEAGGGVHDRHRQQPAAGRRGDRAGAPGRRRVGRHHHDRRRRGDRLLPRVPGSVPQLAAVPLAPQRHRAQGHPQAEDQQQRLHLQPDQRRLGAR